MIETGERGRERSPQPTSSATHAVPDRAARPSSRGLSPARATGPGPSLRPCNSKAAKNSENDSDRDTVVNQKKGEVKYDRDGIRCLELQGLGHAWAMPATLPPGISPPSRERLVARCVHQTVPSPR